MLSIGTKIDDLELLQVCIFAGFCRFGEQQQLNRMNEDKRVANDCYTLNVDLKHCGRLEDLSCMIAYISTSMMKVLDGSWCL